MAQYVDVPGHGPVEFPDNMSDEEIGAAIKRNFMIPKNWREANPLPNPNTVENLPRNNIPTMAESIQQELATRNPLEKFNMGIGTALNRPALGLKAAVTPLSVLDKQQQEADRQVQGTMPGFLGGLLGDAAVLYGPTSAVTGLASRVPSVIGRTAANAAGQGAVGAGYGALVSPDNRRQGALFGAIGGGAGGVVGDIAAGQFRPAAGTPGAELMNEGVPLTPGQAAGGWTNLLEQTLGTRNVSVAKRRAEALQKWSANTVNDTLPPGATPAAPGDNIIAHGASEFDKAYTRAYSGMGNLQADQSLNMQVQGIRNMAGITKADRTVMNDELDRINDELSGGGLDGRAMKALIASYDGLATEAFKDPAKGRLGQAYAAAADALKAAMARQYPQAYAEVSAIDKNYTNFLATQRAAGKAAQDEGVFSPGNLKQSIKDMDNTRDKRAVARETIKPELMDEAKKGIEVLGPSIPQIGPGTAEKTILANPKNWLQSVLYGIPGFAYSKAGRSFLTGDNALQNAMRNNAYNGPILTNGTNVPRPIAPAISTLPVGILSRIRARTEE